MLQVDPVMTGGGTKCGDPGGVITESKTALIQENGIQSKTRHLQLLLSFSANKLMAIVGPELAR